MKLALFTKPFGNSPPKDVAEVLVHLGVPCVDLLVRPSATVSPDRPELIREAARAFCDREIEVAMVTTDIVEASRSSQAIFAQTAAAGIDLVRLGFFPYDPTLGYAGSRDDVRRRLAELQELARDEGVRLALQLHHGTVHPSGALTAWLVSELDPSVIKAYIDPGNQVFEGSEDWRITFDLLRDRIACVGVKDAAWGNRDGTWRADWVALGDGMVPWATVMAGLERFSFSGVLSLHLFRAVAPNDIPTMAAHDIGVLRGLLSRADHDSADPLTERPAAVDGGKCR